ncbi:hypothetical protein DCAR_0314168 [Daucus carota subsp. sativus]|uniref:Protein-serine/threonine phosphatase n=2 Tax=Daucus carota subsp. sativus TaxID=79200 RepID=A0AAF0WU48_DAUCS|nr:PREDICTED: uncharacterized protein LOC108215111 [Daucus carota subsp. sativus]WOG94871.1 hypothetical protein DCAR_0314168 [Daucus carota subsp. sativus]
MYTHKLCVYILGFIVHLFVIVNGESSTCLTVYNEGGAPAVFQSPKCPRWKLPEYGSSRRSRSPVATCQVALHQGRRKAQEDRLVCNLDVRIPFPGPAGITEVAVGVAAIFDGHNGAEASEMASKLLIEYFMLHIYFILDTTFSLLSEKAIGRLPNKGEDSQLHNLNFGRFKLTLDAILDGSVHLEILKESLLRAIRDIDATFSKEASRNKFGSGSTATVILIADDHILIANVGDSKAFLCSEIFQSPPEAKATLLRLYRQKRREGAKPSIRNFSGFTSAASSGLVHFSAVELTRDHHPDREDERSRVESAGGYVLEWAGVSRVNGELAVSRAIGDLPFKSYGVTSVPEVMGWRPLHANDTYLVAASDGVFEKLSPQEVCDLLWELHNQGPMRSEVSPACPYSLADCIVSTAFDKGSTDNMAAIVVPFRSTGFSKTLLKDRLHEQEKFELPALGQQKYIHDKSQLEHSHPSIRKFDRLLVEGKDGGFETFYLSENLDEYDDTVWSQRDDQEHMHDQSQALPYPLNSYCGGSLDLYSDQNMCLRYGMTNDGHRDQCPEGIASFLSLLESIPIYNVGSDYGSNEHTVPYSRYILKKRFDRGSYGEVWLAFHWNSSIGTNASRWRFPSSTFDPIPCDRDVDGSFTSDCGAGIPDDIKFILKRIMVERGNAVYLSGLREKHFGEVFYNASTVLGSAIIEDSVLTESESNLFDMLITNDSAAQETEFTWSTKNTFPEKDSQQKDAFEEGLNHIARYVESFESRSNEIWLVFRHEGISLSKLMYTVEEVENDSADEQVTRVQLLHPSEWWHWLKTTEAGQEEMRNLIRQLLMALKSCHDRNITHRDIKPENMVICFEDLNSGRCLKGTPSGDQNYTTKMRIIDFGSAMDEYTVNHLYGSLGPSRAEQTYEYTPPEALLNASWYRAPTNIVHKYDMWSVGVVFLELILGSPNVFRISSLSRILLDQHIEGWNESLKDLAYKLRSLMEMCILVVGNSSKHHRTCGANNMKSELPASWKCSEDFFAQQIKNYDPLKIGFPNVLALRLVRQLLLWDPEDRLSVDEALRHPYFSHNAQGHIQGPM